MEDGKTEPTRPFLHFSARGEHNLSEFLHFDDATSCAELKLWWLTFELTGILWRAGFGRE